MNPVETGFYYLQSRYYDAESCRFLSGDNPAILKLMQGNVLGTNLYVYCKNTPIISSDTTGMGQFQLVGVGLQIEVSIGALVGGVEFVWFTSAQVNVGGRNRSIPYVYLYGGVGIGASASTTAAVKKLIANPKKLFNPKSLFLGLAISVCVFAIFGYANFRNPSAYLGPFVGVYGSAWNAKIYSAWCSTCVVIGAGWSSSMFSAGGSYTRYWFASTVFSGIGNLFGTIQGKAKNLK